MTDDFEVTAAWIHGIASTVDTIPPDHDLHREALRRIAEHVERLTRERDETKARAVTLADCLLATERERDEARSLFNDSCEELRGINGRIAEANRERDEARAEVRALLRAAAFSAKCCACYGEGDPDRAPLARVGEFFIHRDLDCLDIRKGKMLGRSQRLDELRAELIAEHFAATHAADKALEDQND